MIAFLIAITLVGGGMVAAQDKKPPEKLVFRAKRGHAIFTHAAPIDRENLPREAMAAVRQGTAQIERRLPHLPPTPAARRSK